jgi:RNA-splicing ligase RtcB
MENVNKETLQNNQISLSVNVQVPNTIVNINQKYIQEALQQIVNELFRNHPEALNGNSPAEVCERLNMSSIPKNTGKWKNLHKV